MLFLQARFSWQNAIAGAILQVWLLHNTLQCHCKIWNFWGGPRVEIMLSSNAEIIHLFYKLNFSESSSRYLTGRKWYIYGVRFIGGLANVTFLKGVWENVSKNGTRSSQTIDYFKQVAVCNFEVETYYFSWARMRWLLSTSSTKKTSSCLAIPHIFWNNEHSASNTNIHTYKHTNKHIQTNKQTNRQTDKHALHIYSFIPWWALGAENKHSPQPKVF